MSAALGRPVLLKMDALQPTGSFKLRGIGACVADAQAAGISKIISSSGGNAGLAAAYAAREVGMSATVVLPNSTPASVADRLRAYGAEAIFHGNHWDEANKYAEGLVEEAGADKARLVHPFEGESTWQGHATLVDEVAAEIESPPAAVVTVVGGGGLLMGILRGLTRQAPGSGWADVPVVACETIGADSLNQSIAAGELITLPSITSVAKSLGAATVSPHVFAAASDAANNVTCTTVSDKQAVEACLRFADEHRVLVEPACGAGLAAVYGCLPAVMAACEAASKDTPLLVEICGGALVDRAQLEQWAEATGAK